jgi:DNA-binding CsgD family transcriptional regulator
MRHIIILTLVINLVAGTAVFLYALEVLRRHRRPFLKSLLKYILYYNVLIVVDLSYQYILANVFDYDIALLVKYPALTIVLLSLVYYAEFGITFSLSQTVVRLKGSEISITAKWLFALWLALFGLASVYGLILLFQKWEYQVFYWVHAVWIFTMNIIILFVLLKAVIEQTDEKTEKNLIRPFALIFFGGYTAFSISHLDFYFFKTGIEDYYDPIVLILINLCPMLWLHFWYKRKSRPPEISENIEKKLDKFCEKFNISQREKEIIQQVMIGKSNKEIEKILFISHNTVKNHIYNVYQKVNAGSRSKLIHLINRFDLD